MTMSNTRLWSYFFTTMFLCAGILILSNRIGKLETRVHDLEKQCGVVRIR